jgi:hypothetical protein
MEFSGQLHVSAALLPRKQPPAPTEKKARWGPKDGGEQKIFLAPPGIEPQLLGNPTHSCYYNDRVIAVLSFPRQKELS